MLGWLIMHTVQSTKANYTAVIGIIIILLSRTTKIQIRITIKTHKIGTNNSEKGG